jgi:hypothetical protein
MMMPRQKHIRQRRLNRKFRSEGNKSDQTSIQGCVSCRWNYVSHKNASKDRIWSCLLSVMECRTVNRHRVGAVLWASGHQQRCFCPSCRVTSLGLRQTPNIFRLLFCLPLPTTLVTGNPDIVTFWEVWHAVPTKCCTYHAMPSGRHSALTVTVPPMQHATPTTLHILVGAVP